jgi:tRNA nucleotidyltransferase/poly(A) polymerase
MIQLENAVKHFSDKILTELKEAGVTCWIGGGAIRDYFMAVPINTDYDIFFPSPAEKDKALMYLLKKGGKVLFENTNATKVLHKKRTIDIINHYFDSPQASIEAFDFTVSMFAVDTEKVYHGETSFMDLAKRQLMINKITYPPSTLYRAFKYYKKGFSMCKGEMEKIVLSLQGEKKEKEEDDPVSSRGSVNFFGID